MIAVLEDNYRLQMKLYYYDWIQLMMQLNMVERSFLVVQQPEIYDKQVKEKKNN